MLKRKLGLKLPNILLPGPGGQTLHYCILPAGTTPKRNIGIPAYRYMRKAQILGSYE
jgi:hypothetical protein